MTCGDTCFVRRLGQVPTALWTTCRRRYITPWRDNGVPRALGNNTWSSWVPTTALNLRGSPNDGLQLLALAVRRAPPLDNPQEFSVFGQKRHQGVTCAALHGTTIVV